MDHDQLIATLVGVLALQGSVLVVMAKTLTASRTAAEQSTQANAAVNNTTEGDHRMWDMVAHIRDEIGVLAEAQADFTEKGWRHLPPDIGDATALTLKIRGLEYSEAADAEAHAAILKDLGKLRSTIEALSGP